MLNPSNRLGSVYQWFSSSSLATHHNSSTTWKCRREMAGSKHRMLAEQILPAWVDPGTLAHFSVAGLQTTYDARGPEPEPETETEPSPEFFKRTSPLQQSATTPPPAVLAGRKSHGERGRTTRPLPVVLLGGSASRLTKLHVSNSTR